VGLLGTLFTMREPFFREGLNRLGVDVLVPEDGGQQRVHQIIYEELCRGEIRAESRRVFLEIMERLGGAGAQGIVLGCTEIPLLVRPEDCALPLFNTAVVHADKALEFALSGAGL